MVKWAEFPQVLEKNDINQSLDGKWLNLPQNLYLWRKRRFKPPIEEACFELHFKQGQVMMIHDQNVEILLRRNHYHIDKNTRSQKVWFSGNRPDLFEIH